MNRPKQPEVRVIPVTTRTLGESRAIKAMGALENSSALAAMRALEKSPVFEMTKSLENSPALAAIRALDKSPVFEMMKSLENSTALAAMRGLDKSPVFDAMKALENSPALTAMRALNESPVFKAMKAFETSPVLAAMQGLRASPLFEALVRHQRTNDSLRAEVAARAVAENDVFQTIGAASDARLRALVRQADEVFNQAAAPSATSSSARLNEAVLVEELREALSENGHAKTLSASALVYFVRLLMSLWVVYQAIAQWPEFQKGVCDLQARLLTLEARQQFRKVTQEWACAIPRDTLRSMRFTDRAGVPLFARPAVRSQIRETLPKGAVLTVLDDSHRSWLYVHVSVDGVDIEGWISRKFVRPFVQ